MSESALTETEDYSVYVTPTAHAATHQDGGADEISVAALSGELADEQKSAWAKVSGKPSAFPPEAHHAEHELGGDDALLPANLQALQYLLDSGNLSAVNSFDITGLHGDAAHLWLLVLQIHVTSVSVDTMLYMRINDDDGANYTQAQHGARRYLTGTAEFHSGASNRTDVYLGAAGYTEPSFVELHWLFSPKSGKRRTGFNTKNRSRVTPSGYCTLANRAFWWNNENDNITKLSFWLSDSQTMTGTWRLYRLT